MRVVPGPVAEKSHFVSLVVFFICQTEIIVGRVTIMSPYLQRTKQSIVIHFSIFYTELIAPGALWLRFCYYVHLFKTSASHTRLQATYDRVL